MAYLAGLDSGLAPRESNWVPSYYVTSVHREYLKGLKVGDMIIKKIDHHDYANPAAGNEPLPVTHTTYRPVIIMEIHPYYVYGDKDKYYATYKVFTVFNGAGEITGMDAGEILEAAGMFDMNSLESTMV